MSGVKKFNNPSWNIQLDKVCLYAFCEKIFTPEECEKIIKIGKEKGFIKGTTKDTKTNIRQSSVSWLFSNDDLEWVFKKLTDTIVYLNKEYFGFDIFGFNEGLQFTNYKSPSDKYGKHVDRSQNIAVRKLSVSIQLNNPNDYEGGELWLYDDDKGIKMKKEQGTLILFPSYVLHEVKPVTKGERNSLVCWVTGKQFK